VRSPALRPPDMAFEAERGGEMASGAEMMEDSRAACCWLVSGAEIVVASCAARASSSWGLVGSGVMDLS